ncbi:hypothetical protein BDQ17DRAFT_220875 [Cyathus striatus]|nr:hypothetical protein BDQ17DRAFT_220875 [Cyathus striatus]
MEELFVSSFSMYSFFLNCVKCYLLPYIHNITYLYLPSTPYFSVLLPSAVYHIACFRSWIYISLSLFRIIYPSHLTLPDSDSEDVSIRRCISCAIKYPLMELAYTRWNGDFAVRYCKPVDCPEPSTSLGMSR